MYIKDNFFFPFPAFSSVSDQLQYAIRSLGTNKVIRFDFFFHFIAFWVSLIPVCVCVMPLPKSPIARTYSRALSTSLCLSLSHRLSVFLPLCLSVSLSLCLSFSLSFRLSVSLSL